MKRYVCLFLSISLSLFCLVSCTKMKYRSDVEPSSITDKIQSALPLPDGYGHHGDDYLSHRFYGIKEYIDAYSIICSESAKRADLIAVFRAKNAYDVQNVLIICEAFLDDQRALFSMIVEQYLPSESERLDGAQTRTFGNYVVACVLSPEDAQKAFSEIEQISK